MLNRWQINAAKLPLKIVSNSLMIVIVKHACQIAILLMASVACVKEKLITALYVNW